MADTVVQVLNDGGVIRAGDVVEVKCTVDGCPHPLVGRYLATVHAAHGSEGDEVAHRVRAHEVPEAFELPPSLTAAWLGISPGV